jgi:hypothetical protein
LGKSGRRGQSHRSGTIFRFECQTANAAEAASSRARAKQSIARQMKKLDCFVTSGSSQRRGKLYHSRGAKRPSFARNLIALIEEGAGNAGCPMHPQPGVRWGSLSMHTSIHSGGTGNIRHSPRNGFTAYNALSPVTNSFCHRRGLNGISYPGWAECASARLDINNGCQDHTPSPYASMPLVSRASLDRSRVLLALRPHAHTTSSRPPHPASRFVTIGRNVPLAEAGCARASS